ncbi:MAG: hypothetical protein J5737_03690 [Bacteroidales bacterium]|nr:hypothetical protein [Bacteroidales bacterium]
MGFLKNIVGGAVSDGIGNALSKAVEKAVAPAAQRFANKQAEAIDDATKRTDQVMQQTAAAMDNAQAQLDAAAAGEPVPAGPQDPAQAPADGTAAAAAPAAAQRPLTEEERKQAAEASAALKGFGMMFSGAIAQAKKEAEDEAAAKKAAEAAIFENWEQNLGAYPKWDVGGSHFILEEETPRNGYPAYRLILDGRPYFVELYAAKLRAAGFIARGCSNPQDLNADSYYKMIDGVCWTWNRTDACMDGQICTYFYVDTPPKPRQEPAQSKDLGGLAKGLFKKILG